MTKKGNNTTNTYVTTENLAELIKSCYFVKDPLFIWGDPGIGKSEIVAQAAKQLSELIPGFQPNVIDRRLSTMENTDLMGLPNIDSNNRTSWSTPSFLPTDPNWKGIIFFDEFNQAQPSTMNACYQLILDRKLGDYTLPDGALIVAASNEADSTNFGEEIPKPLANRFAHCTLIADSESWATWAIKAGIRPEVISFVRNNPGYFWDHNRYEASKIYATPRSWAKVSKIIDMDAKLNVSPEIKKLHIAARVGEDVAALVYQNILKAKDMPDIDKILNGEDTKCKSNDIDVLYMIVSSCVSKLYQEQEIMASSATTKTDKDKYVNHYINAIKYFKTFENRNEFRNLGTALLVKNCQGLFREAMHSTPANIALVTQAISNMSN